MDIKGKSALVTGAASGIGRATAQMLAERGVAKIVIVDVDEAALRTLAGTLRVAGTSAIANVVDLRNADAVARLYEEAHRDTGGLDIVFNNAGRMTGGADFPDCDVASMVATVQVNLIAMMVGTRIAVEHMRRRKAPGVIVNTSSMAAFSHMPADPAYSASKHGILAFTQSCKPLSEQFKIRVMAICPGITDTAIVPKDAAWLRPFLGSIVLLTPEDIAREVCRIVEDDALAGDYVAIGNQQVAPA